MYNFKFLIVTPTDDACAKLNYYSRSKQLTNSHGTTNIHWVNHYVIEYITKPITNVCILSDELNYERHMIKTAH